MKQSAINQARDFKAKSDSKGQEIRGLSASDNGGGGEQTLNNNVGRKRPNFLSGIFQSNDNLLLVLLIILIMDDKENFPLAFALLYLLI